MSDPFNLDVFDANADDTSPAALKPVQADYLRGLNPQQKQAVETTEGPLLVLAGAGTGKTRVLTTRLAHIIRARRCFPSRILAVTFTNKAAREMQERVAGLIGAAVEGLWLGTFHAIGVRILRRHAERVGLKSNFTILDTDDQLRLLKQVLEAEDIDVKKWPPRALAAQIDRWKDRGLTPATVAVDGGSDFANGRGGALYATYQQRLQTLNACDFGDLLLHCLELFRQHQEVLQQFQEQFSYILVDEYQDTNLAQYALLKMLAGDRHNICCVGDDDQSIYSWRGAEVGNILRFEKDFPGATVIRLEQNYRSTPHILAAASGLIKANQDRLGKTLWTESEAGEPVRVQGLWDGEGEARFIGDEIEALQRQGHALNDIAILVRASFQTREFEERFITLGLPYRLIGGARFYERAEIRDAIAYCRVIAQPDDDLAFERIVNKPKRGLGPASVQAIHQLARRQSTSMTRAAWLLCESEELGKKARRSLSDLMQNFQRWRQLNEEQGHIEVIQTLLEESGYTDMLQADRSPDAPGRLENLKELVHAMEAFDNLAGFLEHVSLVADNEQAAVEDAVSLMTLHGAKGLEFDSVFLPGWEEGLFPHQRSLDEGGNASLEEERRLAYVGLTRARKRATISYVGSRRMFDRWMNALPSRFIDELPLDTIEREAEQGMFSSTADPTIAFDDGYASYSAAGPRRRRLRPFSANPVLEADVQPAIRTTPSNAQFQTGCRIFHQKFGYGRITQIDGNKLTVDFEKAGVKRVIDAFVEMA